MAETFANATKVLMGATEAMRAWELSGAANGFEEYQRAYYATAGLRALYDALDLQASDIWPPGCRVAARAAVCRAVADCVMAVIGLAIFAGDRPQ